MPIKCKHSLSAHWTAVVLNAPIIETSYDVTLLLEVELNVTLLLGIGSIFILPNKFYSSVLDSNCTLNNCMKTSHPLLGGEKTIPCERKKKNVTPLFNDASRCFACIVTKYTMIHYYKSNRSRVSPMHMYTG